MQAGTNRRGQPAVLLAGPPLPCPSPRLHASRLALVNPPNDDRSPPPHQFPVHPDRLRERAVLGHAPQGPDGYAEGAGDALGGEERVAGPGWRGCVVALLGNLALLEQTKTLRDALGQRVDAGLTLGRVFMVDAEAHQALPEITDGVH